VPRIGFEGAQLSTGDGGHFECKRDITPTTRAISTLEEFELVRGESGPFKPQLDEGEAITLDSVSHMFNFRHDCHHLSPAQGDSRASQPEVLSHSFLEMAKPGKSSRNS
jgi:hypothetical protein